MFDEAAIGRTLFSRLRERAYMPNEPEFYREIPNHFARQNATMGAKFDSTYLPGSTGHTLAPRLAGFRTSTVFEY